MKKLKIRAGSAPYVWRVQHKILGFIWVDVSCFYSNIKDNDEKLKNRALKSYKNTLREITFEIE